MTFKRILQRVAAPAAMAAAIVGVSLTAAPSASATSSDCPSNYICAFENENFTGRMVGNTGNVSNIGDYMNDRTTSIVNNTDRVVCFYDNADYDGSLTDANPHVAIPNIGSYANDRITSWHFC
ncbi:peptidase inhibitor family I36 protein [Streptomyces fuscichromogenes]|uniref:peptidase inhibitor family I36 protein n=1 Tax=Streptomyces fuscichromogenes TaxID=1324013 RepID=UPI00382B17A2